MNEDGVVNDTVALYKWLQNRTTARVFFWGHSLGSGVATATLARLNNEGLQYPTGLVLEAPFSSVIDVVRASTIVKVNRFAKEKYRKI